MQLITRHILFFIFFTETVAKRQEMHGYDINIKVYVPMISVYYLCTVQ